MLREFEAAMDEAEDRHSEIGTYVNGQIVEPVITYPQVMKDSNSPNLFYCCFCGGRLLKTIEFISTSAGDIQREKLVCMDRKTTGCP